MAGIQSLIGNRAPTGAVALKCDLFGAIASNINASVGATSQLASDLFNFWNVGRTNDANREIADKNNAAAIALARENNAWQEQLLRQNQDWSSAEAEKAYKRELEKMRLEMDWNSPVRQVERLRAAGLNPALAFGGANTTSVAGATAPQAQPTSSGVTPSMPVLTSPRMEAFQLASPAAAMRDIGEALAAMSAARKSGAETEVIEKSLDDVLRKYKADADFAVVGVTLEHEFARGDRTRAQQLADLKIAEVTESIHNLTKQGLYTEALTAVEKVEELIKENELDKSNIELQYLPEQLRAAIDGVKATAYRDRAAGDLSVQEERRIKALLPHEITINKYQAGKNAVDLVQAWEDYNNTQLTPEQRKLLQDKVSGELKQAIMDNSENWWNPVQWVAYLISPLARTVGIALHGGASATVTPKTPKIKP